MYAIITDGSRQYRAEEGKLLTLDYREIAVGATLELTEVLLIESSGAARIGQPRVAGAKVVTEVVDHTKVKTQAQYFRRRKASRRLRGHTQEHVKVLVKQIIG